MRARGRRSHAAGPLAERLELVALPLVHAVSSALVEGGVDPELVHAVSVEIRGGAELEDLRVGAGLLDEEELGRIAAAGDEDAAKQVTGGVARVDDVGGEDALVLAVAVEVDAGGLV